MSAWLIDTHCHLDLFPNIQNKSKIEDSLPIKTITVTNAPSFFPYNNTLFENSENIKVAVGLHPELVATHHKEFPLFERYLEETKYVGEIGLDGSPMHKQSFELQVKVFKRIVEMTAHYNSKLLTVHSRNAARETIDILSPLIKGTKCRAILHWYSGDEKSLQLAIDQGFYFSINNKMINSLNGKKLISKMPLDRILTETDAPFTFQSIENRKSLLSETVNSLAILRNIDVDTIRSMIFNNFKSILLEIK